MDCFDGLTKLCFLFGTLIMLSCGKQNQNLIVNSISVNEVLKNKKHYGLTVDDAEYAIKIGLFEPGNIDCKKEYFHKELYQPELGELIDLIMNFTEQELAEVLEQLYLLFGDPIIPEKLEYEFNAQEIEKTIQAVGIGKYAPQCEGITKLSNFFLTKNNTIETGILRLVTVEHTLGWIFLRPSNKVVIYDAQNGFLYPYSDNNTIIPMNALDSADGFYWLDYRAMESKKYYSNIRIPCNYLPYLSDHYTKLPFGSNYKYAFYGKSFHSKLWFDLNQIDVKKFKTELRSQLLKIYESYSAEQPQEINSP